MALRQRVCQFQPALAGPLDYDVVVPRPRPAVTVGFRREGQLDGVIAAIRANPRVVIDAPVGAGKSVRLPTALAREMSLLVIHVLPNPFLAQDLHAFVSVREAGVGLMLDPVEEFPDSGVVIVPAPVIVAKWLASGVVDLPECLVYHDECHESDAYTYLVKTLAGKCSGVVSYVASSGTHGAGGYRRIESAAELVQVTIPSEVFSAPWDFGDANQPWAVASIVDNTLIYEDDPRRAKELVSEYAAGGFQVYRLHSRMSMELFQAAMRALRDPRGGITVLIADYSFRSGFTFPVSTIIDTGLVRECIVADGVPIWQVRQAYQLERYQAMGRGGRIAGLKARYYVPDDTPPARICDLAAIEMEAVALVYRLLGFAVPKELQSAVMAKGCVPRNLLGALQGFAPLALMKGDDKVVLQEFFTPSGRRSPYLRDDVEINPNPMDLDPTISADVARKHGFGGMSRSPSPVHAPRPLRPRADREIEQRLEYEVAKARAERNDAYVPSRRDSGYAELPSVEDAADALQSMTAYEDPIDALEMGKYYYAVGAATDNSFSPAFPDGVDSVMRLYGRDKSMAGHYALSPYNRGVALSCLLTKYNVRTCEFRILSMALTTAKQQGGSKEHGALRQWARVIGERLSFVLTELRSLAPVIVRFTDDYCSLAEMHPMLREEKSGLDKVMREFANLPSASVGPSKEQLSAFREQWVHGAIVGSVSSGGTEGSVDGDGDISRWGWSEAKLETIPMPTAGRGMRALLPSRSNNPFVWAAGGRNNSKVVHGKKNSYFLK